MKPATLLLWLTLFGGEPNTPSALVGERIVVETESAWTGTWVVGQRSEPVTAQFAPVAGREEITGELTIGRGPTAVTEHWVGRIEGGRLRLTHAGIGEGRLTATTDGRLVGRLSRLAATGEIELLRKKDEARARPLP